MIDAGKWLVKVIKESENYDTVVSTVDPKRQMIGYTMFSTTPEGEKASNPEIHVDSVNSWIMEGNIENYTKEELNILEKLGVFDELKTLLISQRGRTEIAQRIMKIKGM